MAAIRRQGSALRLLQRADPASSAAGASLRPVLDVLAEAVGSRDHHTPTPLAGFLDGMGMKRSPIKRTGFKRKKKPAHKRSDIPEGQRCSWSNRCNRRADHPVTDEERYCGTHLRLVAEGVVGTWVKRRDNWTCQACGKNGDGVVIQWAHIITRGSSPFLKFLTEPYPGNSLALCAGCHFAYGHNEGNWRRFIERRWPGHHDRLNRMEAKAEREGGKLDKAAIIIEYRSRLAA